MCSQTVSSVNPKWFRGVVLATYLLVSMFGLHLHKITGCTAFGCGSSLGHPLVCTHSEPTEASSHEHGRGHSHAGHQHRCGIDRRDSTDSRRPGADSISHSLCGDAQDHDSRNGHPQCEWRSDHAGRCAICDHLWSLSQFGFAVCESIASPTYSAVSSSPHNLSAPPETIRIEPASRGPPSDLSA